MADYRWAQITCFNPRPRAGGDADKLVVYLEGSVFQSTPPRGGRLFEPFIPSSVIVVSIHAPARGATGVMGRGPRS